MKTVVVFAKLEMPGVGVTAVVEHGVYDPSDPSSINSASEFIEECEAMWKRHAKSYEITNVVIG